MYFHPAFCLNSPAPRQESDKTRGRLEPPHLQKTEDLVQKLAKTSLCRRPNHRWMRLGPEAAWESTRGRGSGGAAAPFKILFFAVGIPDTSCSSSLPLGFFSSKLQRSCLNLTFIIVINTTTASRHFLATFGISPPPLAPYCHHSRVIAGTVVAKTEYPLKTGAQRLLRADASFIIHCLCLGLPPGKRCWYLVEPGQLCRELGSPRCPVCAWQLVLEPAAL